MRYRRLVALVVLTNCTLPSTSPAAAIFTTIDVPGAPCTLPFAINNGGQIVGYYAETCTAVGPYPNGPVHGFLLDRGTFTTIDFPGATSTRAHGINNGGQIVGDYACSTVGPGAGRLDHRLLLDRGLLHPLSHPLH